MKEKKKSSVTSSADIIGGNDDLLLEILLLLPVISLLRFRLVSKHWRSLIDTESFHRLHCDNQRRRRPQHQFILRSAASQELFICDLTARTLRPLRFNFEYPYVKILQSSHGLLLLECRTSPGADKRICVYNPTTSKSRNLLRLGARDSSTCSRFCLLYDPSKSYDYTVFRLITHTADLTLQMEVYDSRTQQWECKGKFNDETLGRFPQGAVCKDRLYFIKSDRFFCPRGVISTVVNRPICRRRMRSVVAYVVESNGHLHYMSLSFKKNKSQVIVYEMELGRGKSWMMSSDRSLRATFGVKETEVLGFVRGERELGDSILVYHVHGKIMLHRFSDGVSEEIVDFSKESYCMGGALQFRLTFSHHYIQTLASLN